MLKSMNLKDNFSMRDDYIMRRVIGCSVLSVLIITLMFILFEYNRLHKLYEYQIKNTQSIVGVLIDKYPNDEIDIVKSIYNSDYSKVDIGEKAFKKFGYGLENKMSNDKNFGLYLKSFFRESVLVFLVMFIVVTSIIYYFIRYINKRLSKIYFIVDKMSQENYLKDTTDLEDTGYLVEYNEYFKEGTFSKINNCLYELNRSLKIKFIKLEKEKESVKSLVTDISHQLKTPLASLKLYNTLLIEEELDEDEAQEFLLTNKNSINKLENLINSLVNISRLEISMINIKKEDNDIKNTILNAIKSVVPKAKIKNITLNINEFDSRIIPHDKKWTEESIFNVLDNAVKYTQINGEINISVEETVNYFKIIIEDNGSGIKKSEFNNIFKRFYRGISEEVESIEGSGVGLYLSRKILEEQGGNIIVSSKVGVGSKFSLFLTTM
ncbi:MULTISPECIES: sensor histidine kinase [unclassified Clostridioides]|uniref:sensor histidine kinase n=1 Tax=unclassified Clostridioides TaxID=2635829 RepID=UPI0007BB7FEA|nr:HAMP domain-containing histidine kinase [Clostridioides sp. ZZV14-6387]CZR98050.1 Sensor protein SrrB [Clostridioides difficile]CZS02677.1 Sensor protein SrrB [Clostridioides difficile]